ncbi:hypothetical protein PQR70_31295 [Paraburkholderia madseniana]|uniref:hypothetical protein n=1 Tax=Paraburkholderia madseniana TaxID=2599607 RepID=UPI0038B700F0
MRKPAATTSPPHIDDALHHAIQLLRELDTTLNEGISAIEPAVLLWILEQREPALIHAVKANDASDELQECLRFLQWLRAQAASHHAEAHRAAEAAIARAFDCESSRPTREDFEHVLLRENHYREHETGCRVVRVLRSTMGYGEPSAPPGHPLAWAGRATGRCIEVREPVSFIEPVRTLFTQQPHTAFITQVDALPPSLDNATTSRQLLVVDASRHDVSSFGQGFDRRHWHCETRAFRNTALHTSLVEFFALERGAVLLPAMELFRHSSRFRTELPVLYVGPVDVCLVVYPVSVAALQRQLENVSPPPLEQMLDEHRRLDRVQSMSANRIPGESGKPRPILNLHLADLDATLDTSGESLLLREPRCDYGYVPSAAENMLDVVLSVLRQDGTSAWLAVPG